MKSEFDVNEIVWGKVSGYPWWPGFIYSKMENIQYEVIFFSDLSKAILQPEKIQSFTERDFSLNIDKKGLKYSLQMALKISRNEISLIEAIQ